MELQHNQSRHVKQNVYEKQVIGVPITSQDYRYWITNSAQTYLPDHQYQFLPPPSKTKHDRVNSATNKVVKFRQNLHIFAQGVREHVRLGPKLSETVKGKLRLGARILHVGGLHKIFSNNFNIIDGEKLFTSSQCYLSTTAGPIAGLLFVSSERVGFCSDRSIKISSPPNGRLIKQHYKMESEDSLMMQVIIPLNKIKRAVESENVKNPRQKYVEIVTEDNFEFWFMGFLNHQRTLRHLQHAINPSGLK